MQYPKGFLKSAFNLIRSYGGLCISDEVQFVLDDTKICSNESECAFYRSKLASVVLANIFGASRVKMSFQVNK